MMIIGGLGSGMRCKSGEAYQAPFLDAWSVEVISTVGMLVM